MAFRSNLASFLNITKGNPRLKHNLLHKIYVLNSNPVRLLTSASDNNDDTAPSYGSPLEMYEAKVAKGVLKYDEHQAVMIRQLEDLHDSLVSYTPPPEKKESFFSKFIGFSNSKTPVPKQDLPKKYTHSPPSLYLYGSVGCGKTMLMDFFHETSHIKNKRRVHFHQFMLEVHRRIHEVKKAMPSKNFNLNRSQPYDPIPLVAREISDETWLLCFDEFQVTDIADAMILKRLFAQLWQNGVVIVSTSNRKPDDLYKNGLQRIHFLPFIPILKANSKVLSLDSGIDYRRQTLPAEGKIYFVKRECDAVYEMDLVYEELISKLKTDSEGLRTLHHMRRDVTFQKTCGRILDTTFPEICMRPLGAIDYLEISHHFDTVLIRDIPQMDLKRRSEARRFITLIDTLYDQKVRVICSAEAPPDFLFALSNNTSDYDKHHKRVLIGDLDIMVGDENEQASLFTGEEELFAFERVMSRLTEMQTEDYWKQRELQKAAQEKKEKKKQAMAAASAS